MRYLSEAVGPKDSLVVLPAADQLIDFLYSIIVFLALLLYLFFYVPLHITTIITALCVFAILDTHPCHATLGLEVRMFTYLCYCFQPPNWGK